VFRLNQLQVYMVFDIEEEVVVEEEVHLKVPYKTTINENDDKFLYFKRKMREKKKK